MSWWLYLVIAIVAFVVWDFRRFSRNRQAKIGSAPEAATGPREFGRRRTTFNQSAPPATVRPMAPPPPPKETVEESVSVVLRRQIPPRDEAPRSWLGGLPMMPAGLEWPRSVSAEYPDRGERPLHFVAQICCEDLPPELWGGMGPREGWLLLFIDPNQGCPEGNDAFRILHSRDLGSERQPPEDLGPVHDGEYSGPDYRFCRSTDDVPNAWRRWPVDLVAVPNEAKIVGQRTQVAPDDFARILYEGAPVSDDRNQLPAPPPFTWRGLIYLLNSIEGSFAKPLPDLRIPETLVEKLNRPGYIEAIVPHEEEQERRWREEYAAILESEPADEATRQRKERMLAGAEKRRGERERLRQFLAEHPTRESIIEYLSNGHAQQKEWRASVCEALERLRTSVLSHDLDTALSPEELAAFLDQLSRHEFRYWNFRWVERDGDRLHVSFEERSLPLPTKEPYGMRELIADYYVDPKRRSLIPPDVLPAYEASWRSLYSNRPHRMGGYHDGLQSDAQIGPTSALLLFQIATDDAMHWAWGDGGAYYFYILPADLRRLDFSGVEIVLECH